MNQKDLFQFSMDNISEIILLVNTKGRIEYANKAALDKLEYKDLYDYDVRDIFPIESVLVETKMVGIPDNGVLSGLMAYRSNDTCFPVEARFYKRIDEDGKILYLCILSDVSGVRALEKESKKAEEAVKEALKVKSEFVANVTHELRTPVNGILGNTQALIDIEKDSSKMGLLRLVERGCRDMHAIINNILDFSKLEAGKFALEPRKFHFCNMIDYIQANHRNRITEKGLEFSVTVSPDIPEYIIADELRIVQVFNNLISNAYKFTSVGSIHVEVVKTAQIGNKIELFCIVLDTGIGIAKADQDKLFQSFSQVDASISRKYGGTGLGLNICKQLVELMGGKIDVKSEKGKGTMFSFYIWVGVDEDAALEKTCAEKGSEDTDEYRQKIITKLEYLNEKGAKDKIVKYGEPENKQELEKKLSKLILSVEMENWEKAEMFAEGIMQLLDGAPSDIRSTALRLKMSVQKADYEKIRLTYDKFTDLMSRE